MVRFFVSPEELRQDMIVLTGENAAHAKVLRLKAGEQVLVCDGEGSECLCSVDGISSGELALSVISHHSSTTEAKVKVSIYMAYPKAGKLEHVIQKATELGAYEIVAFPSGRCISKPDDKSLKKKLERWQKIAASAAEQSGRGLIPEVIALPSYAAALERASKADKALMFYENEHATTLRMALEAGAFKTVSLLTGPEGGLEEKEVAQARDAMEQTEQELRTLEGACAKLPPREEADLKTRELKAFREQWNDIQMEVRTAPAEPQQPQLPNPFTGLSAQAAREMVHSDAKTYTAITSTKTPNVLIFVGLFGLLAAGGLIYLMAYVFAAVAGLAGLAAFAWGIYEKISMKKQTRALLEKYGDGDWQHWGDPIAEYEQKLEVYKDALKEYQDINSDLEVRLMVLRKKKESLCGLQEPDELLEFWQQTLAQWDAYYNARREALRAKSHFETLSAMVKPVEKPTMEDNLTHSETDTARLLSDCQVEQQRLQNRLGQYQGRMEVLGDRDEMLRQLKRINERIVKLEDTYAALLIAQETLTAARAELQRRFAPRITQRAQKLLSRMTGGRYHSLTMSEDFSLQAGAGEEDTVHDTMWRSDGTVDQLYLALRLAVAEELTPEVRALEK